MNSPRILPHRLEGEDGPVLALLNGGMMTHANWTPLLAALDYPHRILRFDFRGQLLAAGPAHGELTGHATDLEALLDHLAIPQAHLLGTSFGALVGMTFAARNPERVLSLAAVTATDFATPNIEQGALDLRRVLAEVRAGGDPRKVFDRMAVDVYSEAYRRRHAEELDERRERMTLMPNAWFEGLDGILACLQGLDLRPLLGKIDCPSLVVVAGEDRVMPLERARALASAIPGASLAEHETAGHVLILEEPGWLAGVYRGFLETAGDR